MNNINVNLNSFSPKMNTTKKAETPKNESTEQKSVDLSGLPNGVSVFKIDGDEITIYKNGDDIKTQVVGNKVTDINLIHEKVKQFIENNQQK